jgi:hypothetical protein
LDGNAVPGANRHGNRSIWSGWFVMTMDGCCAKWPWRTPILLYPSAASAESHAEIEAIRAAYERRFGQEAVLRADHARPVCASL